MQISFIASADELTETNAQIHAIEKYTITQVAALGNESDRTGG
ncbi:hypothetical protein ES703_112475 [subsurface metagenome]